MVCPPSHGKRVPLSSVEPPACVCSVVTWQRWHFASYDQLDISTADMEDVDLYMQSLGVPARRNKNDPQVIFGEQKFYEAKCHLCHVTTLHTQAGGSTLLNGTRLPGR